MRKWTGIILASTVIGAACIGWAATESATSAPATSQPAVDARWTAVLEQLGSPDFKERQQGQKALDKATFKNRDTLKALADRATDDEIKSRLEKRIDELDEAAAIDPPPISLDLNNATLPQLCNALTKATGVPWKEWGGGGRRGAYTLKATDEPLWEAFLKLSAQSGIGIQGYNGVQLMPQSPGIVHGVVHGGFLFFPVTLSRAVNLQATGAHVPELNFQYGVYGDPRIKAVYWSRPQITSAVDDQGNLLYKGGQNNGWSSGQTMISTQTVQSWPIIEGMGKTITVKGTMKVEVAVNSVTVVVPDMEKMVNKPINIAGRAVTFSKFEVKNNQVSLQASASSGNGGVIRRFLGGAPEPGIGMELTAADGTRIWSAQINGGMGATLGTNGQKGPVKGVFTAATRVKVVDVPFEFKDLPVP